MPKLECQAIYIVRGENQYPQEGNSEHPSEIALGRVVNVPYPYILILPRGQSYQADMSSLSLKSTKLSVDGANGSPFMKAWACIALQGLSVLLLRGCISLMSQ